jgi:cytochrome P450
VLLQSLIVAGIDTTATQMTWALSLLLNNREALKKAQQELDVQIGRERQVKESDIKNLVYLQAIIKETMRLYPAGPLPVPHESMEDCTLAGYHIPAGTQLLVNFSKLHRDPHVWSDPNEFQPERFLTSHKGVDVKGQHFELLPFGAGRRMCPGISLALQVTQLTLATLLHAFEIATPLDEPVDMTEKIGLTDVKATPLEVHFTPRLPTQVYALFA